MSNIILSYPNRATAATITGGSWLAGLPVTNLANREMWKVARSTDDALASTQFTADLGALKPVRCVALANHNLSSSAQWRVKVMGETASTNVVKNGTTECSGTSTTASIGTATDPYGEPATKVIPTAGAVSFPGSGNPSTQGFANAQTVGQSTDYSFSGYFSPFGPLNYQPYIVICANTNPGNEVYCLAFFNASTGTFSGKTINTGWSEVNTLSATMAPCGMWLVTWTVRYTQQSLLRTLVYQYLQIGNATPAAVYTADGLSGIQRACHQFEISSVATTYKPTTTAASNIALHYSSGWQSAWRMVFDTLVEWESATWWAGTVGDEYLRSPYAVTAIADDTYSARYISVEINDTANADGYVQIGRLFVGGALQPTYNPAYGLQDGLKDLSTVDAAESGAMWGNEKRRIRYTSFVLAYTTPEEAAYLLEMQRSLGTTGEVLYIPYPADLGESQRWGYIGRMSELSPIDYPYPRVRSVPLKLEEIA